MGDAENGEYADDFEEEEEETRAAAEAATGVDALLRQAGAEVAAEEGEEGEGDEEALAPDAVQKAVPVAVVRDEPLGESEPAVSKIPRRPPAIATPGSSSSGGTANGSSTASPNESPAAKNRNSPVAPRRAAGEPLSDVMGAI